MELSTGQYYGKILKSIDLGGLIISKSCYQDSSSLPLHYHENPYFCYVLNGNYSEHSVRNDFTCSKGDLIFHPQHTEHHNNFSENSATCFNLEFSEVWISKFTETKLNLNSIQKSNDHRIQKSVQKIYNELCNYDDLSSLMIEGLMLETIAGFSRNNSGNRSVPFYLRKITEYLNDNYFTNSSLIHLAQIANVSPEHLVREFRKSFGMTIGEYMRQLKVKRSCHMLLHSDKVLSRIAFEVGFSDQSHFNRVFKKQTGLTPLQYRSSK
ncbi:MAG: AraC family transcriptional regulator [Ignavibacteria bacterium]